MIQTEFGHIVFNVRPQNLAFYKDLFAFLGWPTLVDDESMFAAGWYGKYSLWFSTNVNDAINDYDGPGMNHLGLHAAKQSHIDQMTAYLQEKGVAALFETPRHRPEFSAGPDKTYYQVMFESPDRVLFEIVYIGPRED